MKIGKLDGTFTEFTFVENRDYLSFKDRFLRNTLIALDYLSKNNVLTITYIDEDMRKRVDIMDTLVADTQHNIRIISGDRNAYNHKLNTIMFYDTHGVVFRKNHRKQWFRSNLGYNSPLALLSHELIHCYNDLFEASDYHSRREDLSSRFKKIDYDGNDLSFPNAEEEFVIRMTNQVAECLGEDKRSNYGRSYYPVEDVISTKKKRI